MFTILVLLVHYGHGQGASAMAYMGFCADYPSLGIRTLCSLV